MAKCAKSNCSKPTVGKETLCPDHLRQKKAEELKQAQQKQQMEKERKENEQKRKDAAALQKKNEETSKLKAAKIKEIATQWNVQVKAVVTQVQNLRRANPTVNGINAGNNGNLGTIPGGTNNPVKFTVPANNFKITAAEVFKCMAGFEGSDSGYFKFRVDGVFVHAK